jgi:hypothetical protein
VHDEVIYPIVRQCVDHFIAKEAAVDITTFRDRAFSLAKNQQERQFIQSRLHDPTLRLRQMKQSGLEILGGSPSSNTMTWNASVFWETLSADLSELRQNATKNGSVRYTKI